jgi:hypothetical protein
MEYLLWFSMFLLRLLQPDNMRDQIIRIVLMADVGQKGARSLVCDSYGELFDLGKSLRGSCVVRTRIAREFNARLDACLMKRMAASTCLFALDFPFFPGCVGQAFLYLAIQTTCEVNSRLRALYAVGYSVVKKRKAFYLLLGVKYLLRNCEEYILISAQQPNGFRISICVVRRRFLVVDPQVIRHYFRRAR